MIRRKLRITDNILTTFWQEFWPGPYTLSENSLTEFLHGDNQDQENTWHHELVQLAPEYLNDDFKFRYVADVSRSSEDANVDNVRLLGTSLAGPPNQAPG